MEEGSLLQQALSEIKKRRENCDYHTDHENKLIVDIYDINQRRFDRCECFQRLVSLSKTINEFFFSETSLYPWFSGGDGPTFGFHVTDGIPHLRSYCWYGPSVADEWATVASLIEISRKEESLNCCAMKFWDSDDGEEVPLLLIESAMFLPEWLDEIGPSACKNRCWILNGDISLIRPSQRSKIPKKENLCISIEEALQCLSESKNVESLPSNATKTIKKRINPFIGICEKSTKLLNKVHRAAVLLPRNVAYLLEKNPSLCHCAVAAFERYSFVEPPQAKNIEFSDLVWTTHRFGRTSYALLRTLTSEFWPSVEEDDIPLVYKSAEVNRMKRFCRFETTPHLQHSLQLGMRITAGLDYILSQSKSSAKNLTDDPSNISAEDLVLQHWTALDIACGGNGMWLRKAWSDGPNYAEIDLSSFLTCHIASIDLKYNYPFPKSHMRKDLISIIKNNLHKTPENNKDFIIPSPAEVDDESWIELNGEEAYFIGAGTPQSDRQHTKIEENSLDNVLENFKSFVIEKSDVTGVFTEKEKEVNVEESKIKSEKDYPVEIDPKLVLNILHKVLSSTPDEIKLLTTEDKDDIDLYFERDDLAMEEDEEIGCGGSEIGAIMQAMDLELDREKEESLPDNSGNLEQQKYEDITVLSGLIQSIEASEGTSGPVRNILNEMTLH